METEIEREREKKELCGNTEEHTFSPASNLPTRDESSFITITQRRTVGEIQENDKKSYSMGQKSYKDHRVSAVLIKARSEDTEQGST